VKEAPVAATDEELAHTSTGLREMYANLAVVEGRPWKRAIRPSSISRGP